MASNIVVHQPLAQGEIRLVNFGAQQGEPVLVHTRLDERPKFWALSYCWGSENCLHRFETKGQVLLVTSSLYIALEEFRRRAYVGKLWADAICIDEANMQERQKQIPLMSSIYSQAEQVVIWLGPALRDWFPTSEGLEALESALTDTSAGMQSKSLANLKMSLEDTTLAPLYTVMELFSLPWFRRSWTVQEAVLASELTLWYGANSLPWKTITTLGPVLQGFVVYIGFEPRLASLGIELPTSISCLMLIHKLRIARKEESVGSRVLLDNFRLKAADPRDKIYAFYSLLDPKMREDIPLQLSHTPRQVFVNTAKAFLKSVPPDFSVLGCAGQLSRNIKLSSWVPDFSGDLSRSGRLGDVSTMYRAGGSGQPRTPVTFSGGDADNLNLVGFGLGTIEGHVSSDLDVSFVQSISPQHYHIITERIKDWTQQCRKLVSDRKAPEALPRLFRTSICDRPYGVRQDWQTRCPPVDRDSIHPHAWLSFSLSYFTIGRSFFLTEEVYQGLGPSSIRAGDSILLFEGAPVAYVARRRSTGTTYQLVGECYVDETMDGEAMKAFKESHCPERLFTFD